MQNKQVQQKKQENMLLPQAPGACDVCALPLCIRKQVINMALGNTERMLCLVCLGKESNKAPEEVLTSLISYVKGRDCFYKFWQQYPDEACCPDPYGCFPAICFEL